MGHGIDIRLIVILRGKKYVGMARLSSLTRSASAHVASFISNPSAYDLSGLKSSHRLARLESMSIHSIVRVGVS